MNATSSAQLAPGIHRGIPAETYFAIPAISASFLKRFLFDTPAHAKAMLDGLLDDETSAMSKGTALHAALLEPEVFAKTYAVVPDVRRGTKEWKSLEDANPGKTLIKEKDNADVIGMRDSIWSDAYCARAVRACDQRELTIIWDDAATGITCKARIDLYSTTRQMLLDVKTTGDLSRFEKTAFDQGYDVQLCHYINGLTAVDLPVKTAGILAPEQSAPWLPDVFEPSGAMLAGGFDLIERAMPLVAKCMSSGKWPGYRTSNMKARKLDVPAYRRSTSLDRGNIDV